MTVQNVESRSILNQSGASIRKNALRKPGKLATASENSLTRNDSSELRIIQFHLDIGVILNRFWISARKSA